eukprot:5355450-Pyramimonas_sp.AAC.1
MGRDHYWSHHRVGREQRGAPSTGMGRDHSWSHRGTGSLLVTSWGGTRPKSGFTSTCMGRYHYWSHCGTGSLLVTLWDGITIGHIVGRDARRERPYLDVGPGVAGGLLEWRDGLVVEGLEGDVLGASERLHQVQQLVEGEANPRHHDGPRLHTSNEGRGG